LVRGEADEVFPALVERLLAGDELGGLSGVVTRETQTLPDLLLAEDFEHIPFPRFEGLPLYAYTCPDARLRPMVTFTTGRGCPNACGFCASPALVGRRLRGWSVEQVLDALERLVRVHGIREVSFVDDGFTANPRRALDLCQGIVERGLSLSWFGNARADRVTPELARAMAASGCHQLYLGLESGSQQILDRVSKRTTLDRLITGADILAQAGIHRSVGFMIGLPGESAETVGSTIDLALRIKPERLQFTRFTPLPGTPLSEAPAIQGEGFHDRKQQDQVEKWIRWAYEATTGLRAA